jgi:hypothetical protein
LEPHTVLDGLINEYEPRGLKPQIRGVGRVLEPDRDDGARPHVHDHGLFSEMVFAHGRRRRPVTKREDTAPAEPVDLMAGHITTLAGRLRLVER